MTDRPKNIFSSGRRTRMDPNSTGCVAFHSDDFFTAGSPTSNECSNNLHQIIETCKLLGVPLAPEKIVGPTCQLTFLGIEIDSESLQLCLASTGKIGTGITSWRKSQSSQEKAAALPYWSSCTCMQSGPTWKNIPQANHQSVMCSKRPGPLGSPKC